MLVIVYLNKPYLLHYYKYLDYTALNTTLDLYNTPYTPIHHHTSMYNTMHLYTSRYTSTHHHTPLYITIHPCQHPCIIPCTSIHHHTPLYITIHRCIKPWASTNHHIPLYSTIHLCINHEPLYITIYFHKTFYTPIHNHTIVYNGRVYRSMVTYRVVRWCIEVYGHVRGSWFYA